MKPVAASKERRQDIADVVTLQVIGKPILTATVAAVAGVASGFYIVATEARNLWPDGLLRKNGGLSLFTGDTGDSGDTYHYFNKMNKIRRHRMSPICVTARCEWRQ